MKGAKSGCKAGRSGFFQRVRKDKMEPGDSKERLPMKENININHIRQSSYKLDRSKSHRKGHSLERKIPIVSAQNGGNTKEKGVLREIVSEQNTLSMVPQQFTVRFEQHLQESKNGVYDSIEHQKHARLDNSFKELFNLLQLSKKQDSQSNQQNGMMSEKMPVRLQEQQYILGLMKTMWQAVIKMKQKSYFKEEICKIEGMLKSIVLKLAKPKLQILEECSNMSLKMPPFKYSSPDNIVSFKEQSRQNSVQPFQESVDREQSNWMVSDSNDNPNEQASRQQLEYKKIMYILQENGKKPISVFPSNPIQPERLVSEARTVIEGSVEGQQLNALLTYFNEGATKPMRQNSKSHISSFSSQQTERMGGALLFEQQKVNNSYSNDKLYLKNIVKKAKGNFKFMMQNGQNGSVYQKSQDENKNIKDISMISKKMCSVSSEMTSNLIDEKIEYIPSMSQDIDYDQSSFSKKSIEGSKSRLLTQQPEGDSKRATLNSIVTMLNKKYHKNIQLQPRKTAFI